MRDRIESGPISTELFLGAAELAVAEGRLDEAFRWSLRAALSARQRYERESFFAAVDGARDYYRRAAEGAARRALQLAGEELLGPAATGHLVFAYNVVGDRAPLPPEELFVFRGSLYGFIAVRLDHYSTFATQLSARWDTVSIPTAQFRALARPLRELCCVRLPQGAGAA